MHHKLILTFFVLIAFMANTFACQCPITALDKNELNKYDIIFKGRIKKNDLLKEKSELIFEVNELYKGVITNEFTVLYNALDECKFDLRVGDEWIIYTNYYQVNNARLDFCSRSRKYFKNIKEDYFSVTTGLSYDDEMQYLQSNLGLHKCLKNNYDQVDVTKRNIIPTTNQFIVVILFSILGIVFFYWLVNRFLK